MKSNVILIVADTLREDHSSKLDKLLEIGFQKIDNAFSASPWTLPSHVSMFTGLYPYFHGVHEYYGINDFVEGYGKLGIHAMTKFDNLISLLKDEGYKTIGISANAFISPIFGFNFDSYYLIDYPPLYTLENDTLEALNKYGANYKSKLKLLINLIRNKDFKDFKILTRYKLYKNSLTSYFYYKSKILHKGCNLIRRKIQQIKFNDKFFLFINVMEAHEPYSTDVIGKDVYGKYDYNFLRSVFLGSAENSMIAHYRKYYGIYAENSVNCVLNIILDLSKRINMDDALIIVTADHGNHIGEYGRVYHGFYLSDELLRVPLYIRYPKDIQSDLKLKGNNVSLTLIYSVIKSIIYNEVHIINGNFAISESYGPQHSLNTIQAYFNLNNSEIKKRYNHIIRISNNDQYLTYNMDKDEVIESSRSFNPENVQIIKDYFS
ncbi:Choline-sulfatase [Saccharolobus shibatae B12]|uniref:Choline-sulfatase n=1 Tax=Saccharolobus shibatae (strain ATCC 51178 / DSM 5389 / JCM 8931 / NBRC 15437 / B12) TaxID=523848 RepID=A0A8F5BNK0_SACSH|nr:sulfatase-like hydrolase/transferase [Saccharolobus shibatae]QXJ28551.1 Choline-sulfatase [Saccharolobus shibatae B12]